MPKQCLYQTSENLNHNTFEKTRLTFCKFKFARHHYMGYMPAWTPPLNMFATWVFQKVANIQSFPNQLQLLPNPGCNTLCWEEGGCSPDLTFSMMIWSIRHGVMDFFNHPPGPWLICGHIQLLLRTSLQNASINYMRRFGWVQVQFSIQAGWSKGRSLWTCTVALPYCWYKQMSGSNRCCALEVTKKAEKHAIP